MKVRRMLPPVGYRTPARDLARAAWGFVDGGLSAATFLDGFAKHVGAERAFGVSSGKAALTTILRALGALTGRTKVVFPAYTCYSVPSAIVKAGLEPLPCDLAAGSFDYDYEQLQAVLAPDVLCALSIHLFGIPSDTTRLTALCEPSGIFVVEDAAQALGTTADGRWLGTRADVGFFSLGRGKNVTCGSGGIIVTRREEVAEAVGRVVDGLPRDGVLSDASTLLMLGALSIFITPRLYWLPAGIPWLRLGETIFHDDFPVRALSSFKTRLLDEWPRLLARLNETRLEHSAWYLEHVEGVERHGPAIPHLRFPLVPERAETARRILDEERARVLGISRMYPASVAAIPQLRRWLGGRGFPRAERVAGSLLTLPTHPLVSEQDRVEIGSIVNRALRESGDRLATSTVRLESAPPRPRPACDH